MGSEGGTLARMLVPFELCLGGPLGTGGQMMSWISLNDLGRLINYCVLRGDISGPVNGTAPNAVTNQEFTNALAQALHRPALLRVPARLLVTLLGSLGSEIFLGDQNVYPRTALDHGFCFHDGTIHDALVAILKVNGEHNA